MGEGTGWPRFNTDGRCDTEERMPRIEERPDHIEIDVSDTLTKADYDRLVPRLERLAAERGPLRMLIRLSDFSGWTPPGLWADLKFDLTHQDDMARIAILGESKLERWMTSLSDLFLRAQVKYFAKEKEEQARAWLAGDR